MLKLFRIMQGWFFYFFKSEKIENVAIKRSSICLDCPYADFYFAIEKWKHRDLGVPKNINKMFCSKCGCPLSKKIRSPKETCPMKKW